MAIGARPSVSRQGCRDTTPRDRGASSSTVAYTHVLSLDVSPDDPGGGLWRTFNGGLRLTIELGTTRTDVAWRVRNNLTPEAVRRVRDVLLALLFAAVVGLVTRWAGVDTPIVLVIAVVLLLPAYVVAGRIENRLVVQWAAQDGRIALSQQLLNCFSKLFKEGVTMRKEIGRFREFSGFEGREPDRRDGSRWRS